MRRNGPGRGWALITGERGLRRRFDRFTPVMRELCDEPGDGAGGGGGGGGKDAAYWEAEARKAFQVRDSVKAEMKKLQESGLVLTPEQKERLAQLETQAQQAEEERAKKAGEFETLKKTLTDKQQKELEERDSKITTLSQKFQRTVVRAEFGSVPWLFSGSAESKTVLDVDMAIAVLGNYVQVEDDDQDPRGYRIVVKGTDGQTIVDGKGNPAPFAEALSELINSLPNRDRILRGSGKAGSGASGEVPLNAGGQIDVTKLTPEQRRDPKVMEALKKQRRGGSGMVLGKAFGG